MRYWGFLLWIISTSIGASTYHSAGISDASWHFQGNRLGCVLNHDIDTYGQLNVRYPYTKSPTVAFKAWQAVKEGTQVGIFRMSPSWNPQMPPKRIAVGQFKDPHNIFLNAKVTREMLNFLEEGYKIRFKYKDGQKQVRVDILPIHFNTAFEQYTRCVSMLLPYHYEDIAYKHIYFNSESVYIREDAKPWLDKIAAYVVADNDVHHVHVDGFSDNFGRPGHNMYLSERRAKAVKSYLLRKGVPVHKIKIDWHGQRAPHTTNDTMIGRALNRRVEVKIYR